MEVISWAILIQKEMALRAVKNSMARSNNIATFERGQIQRLPLFLRNSCRDVFGTGHSSLLRLHEFRFSRPLPARPAGEAA